MFTTENTTHEDAVRLLSDRDVKIIDLYNSLGATQKESTARAEKIKEIQKTLCFFKSVIQCGEGWSDRCDKELNKAFSS